VRGEHHYGFSTRSIEKHWSPPIASAEHDGTYLVKADLPGLKKEDIHLELHDG
jgi:HSP20 family molecular chaperone IbpA